MSSSLCFLSAGVRVLCFSGVPLCFVEGVLSLVAEFVLEARRFSDTVLRVAVLLSPCVRFG